VVALYQRLVARLDRGAIRDAIERHALASSRDDVLLELLCLFQIERALRTTEWTLSFPGLVRSGKVLEARRAQTRLQLFYQHTPSALAKGSVYRTIQRTHSFPGTGGLIPDMVFLISGESATRWILVEVKGVQRPVADSARVAALDLLAYRRAFDPVLSDIREPYGLGIAWGAGLAPSCESEICLCTPDTVGTALSRLLP
jgi:hypothetical protein